LERLLRDKFLSMIIGLSLFIAGILSRGQFYRGNMIIGFIIPLSLISIGFGFIFTSIYNRDYNILSAFVRAVLAPMLIVFSVVFLNKSGINSPVIRAGILFLINIAFFSREILNTLKSQN